jgi:hypothetical protein
VLASVKVWPAIAVDVIAVVVFAIVGRSSHGEPNDLVGVAVTAWPFLVGCLIGLIVSRGWRRPAALSTGIVVWLCTLFVGMVLRALTGRGVAVTFVIVAGISLAILLLGWRATFTAIQAARKRSARQTANSPSGDSATVSERRGRSATAK